jgi:hypothetical protein
MTTPPWLHSYGASVDGMRMNTHHPDRVNVASKPLGNGPWR